MMRKLLIAFCVIISTVLIGCSTEFSAENSNSVTVTIANTNVVTLDVGTVSLGDRILFNWKMGIIKGAVAGGTAILLVKNSGTAVVEFYHNFPNVRDDHYQVANQQWTFVGSATAKVITGGTLTMIVRMLSQGSNGTINPGDGELYAIVMNTDLIRKQIAGL